VEESETGVLLKRREGIEKGQKREKTHVKKILPAKQAESEKRAKKERVPKKIGTRGRVGEEEGWPRGQSGGRALNQKYEGQQPNLPPTSRKFNRKGRWTQKTLTRFDFANWESQSAAFGERNQTRGNMGTDAEDGARIRLSNSDRTVRVDKGKKRGKTR